MRRVGARIRVPAPLGERAFRVGEGAVAGLTRGRLAGPDLARPHHGVRVPSGAGDPLLDYAPLLRPGDRFSHTSAARRLGAPLPSWAEDLVHVTAGPGLRMPRGRGVTGHEADGRERLIVGGLPISLPEEAFVSLAAILPLTALVAVGDFLVLAPRRPEPGRPWASPEQLEAAASEPGRRGVRRARQACSLVRFGVESAKETELRLELVLSGLPEPECGVQIHRASGSWIGWFDLVWPRWRVVVEYDGDQHRTSREQYERDQWRTEALAEEGWALIRVRASGLGLAAPSTVARVRRALLTAGWRP